MEKHLIFLLILSAFVKGNAYSAYFDIIHDFGSNFGMSLFGCNKKEMVSLSRVLSANGYANKYMSEYNNLEAFTPTLSRYLFVVDLDCYHSSDLLIKANKTNLFAFPFIWLAFYKNQNSYKQLNSMLSIMVDSNFNLAEKQANGSIYMRKIFKKHIREDSYVIEEYGLWKGRGQDFSISRKNLGITLNSCLVITRNDSLNHLADGRDKHVDSIAKVSYALVSELVSIYNITLQYSVRNSWGYKANQSQWTGMVGELVRKEADIGGTALFFTKDRISFIDYLAAIAPTRAKFVFRQPKLSYVSNLYTLPFDKKVWISTGLLVFLMALIVYIFMKWEGVNNFIQDQVKTDGIILENSFHEAAFITVGALCQQEATTLPYSFSGRMTSLSLFISLMFIHVYYSANIVALLQTPSTSLKTLEDLLNSRMPVAVDDTVYNRFYFETADEPVRKALYQKKVAPPGKPPNYMSIEEGVKKIRQGLFAFHMETGSGYKLVGETFKEDEKCDLQEIGFIQVVDPFLAIQKNSSYKEMFKIGLHLLQENGIQKRANGLIYTKKPICTSTGASFISVGIVDCYPALELLAGGIVASVFVLLLEIYVNYRLMLRK